MKFSPLLWEKTKIPLRYVYSRFKLVEADILKDRPMRGGRVLPVEANDFKTKSALFLPEKSRYDYLLNLPDPSAHSYGNIHFGLERKHTIDAQCFAALILRGYINKNKMQFKEAMNILKFDRAFLSRIQLDMSTPLTKKQKR